MSKPTLDLDLGLAKLSDLFTSQEERDAEANAKGRELPVAMIDPYPNHPFHVIDDESMAALAQSISEVGVITPIQVRNKPDGRYELLSGHRRKRAAELIGLVTIPARVCDVSDDEAAIMMVDSNLQRDRILPSEKGFAYKIRLEAMNHQGKRKGFASVPVEQKRRNGDHASVPLDQKPLALTSRGALAAEVGESEAQISRYIRLTELNDGLLKLVDEGRIKMRPAVELSYLAKHEQKTVLECIERDQAFPSHAQARELRKRSEDGELNEATIQSIMAREKPNQVERIRLPRKRIARFFRKGVTDAEVEETIVQALELLAAAKNRAAAKGA